MSRSRRIMDLLNPTVPTRDDSNFELTDTYVEIHLRKKKRKVITFFLSFLLMCSVCIVLVVTTAAGIAYGYNYSMAEFITFKRSNITVFLRRGQFNDFPDLINDDHARRSGDEDDAFSANINIVDKEQQFNNTDDKKPLEIKWVQGKDTRHYAELITKFSSTINPNESEEQIDKNVMGASIKYEDIPTMTPGRRLSILPYQAKTTTWQSGSSDILNHHINPDDNIKIFRDDTQTISYTNNNRKFKVHNDEESETRSPDIKIVFDNRPKSRYIPMHYWDTSTVAASTDNYNDEVDEDPRSYMPV